MSSRKKIVAGNWKMNKTLSEGKELVVRILKGLQEKPNEKRAERVILIPPFTLLQEIAGMLKGNSTVFAGAQNCHHEERGAYTGEVSVPMLQDVGVNYVIIGHSERRQYFGETNDQLSKKVNLAHKYKISPIYCVGESIQERKSGHHMEVIKKQVDEALFHLDAEAICNTVIAYEPVWAIGTGVTATSKQAQEMHAYIRRLLNERYPANTAQSVSILYGGSCNAKNAKELFSCPDVDGGLIGGASLVAEEFLSIVDAF